MMVGALHGRRLRRVLVTPEFLIDLMQHGAAGVDVVENALPEDVQYVGEAFDVNSLTVVLFVSSESFDEVDALAPIPQHPPTVFRKRPESEPS
jgi:hypothetical protein